jgi:SagB-type dehydrogenase family enzyme
MYTRRTMVKLFGLFLATASAVFLYRRCSQGEAPMSDLSAGQRFHHDSALTWRSALTGLFSGKPPKPPSFKSYPGTPKLALPLPRFTGPPLEETIRRRRSVRTYSADPMTIEQLSQLLWAAQGITGRIYQIDLRTAPSAGALYPFEVYAFVHNVSGIDPGLYHYGVRERHLELVKAGDFRDRVIEAGLGQDMLGDADATFVLCAVFDRLRHKYGERGYRYAYVEAGHISQNIYLQAASMGLGSVAVGAFVDDKLNQLVGVDGVAEAAIQLHATGTL